MKQVKYTREAIKMLKRIDASTSRRIRDKVEQYVNDPASLANNVIIMKGGDGFRRMRVGEWRVIFTEDLVILLVIRVAPRGSAYD
ncbi:MAG: type II toxin-antitoxin system RelE/ParE family toxin [Sphingomonadales bacterium]|jgi:mRNA interferase RelE/StbE|nr:type II toxin-antitoxin system RelE/ParE family toxin [Sphingomonadales bacterium]MBK9004514.1 type II toxin-antitoxin system RelE/ParE family toxin [Sphingomonadales bacterium]MBK9269701.1 type II toxin-antitoxin system RelE/ParE family toxin [Sphingomonadales bacterium]MBP6433358.1 type II toxin-antitoxin system RelE/ParE family toxin [Sphingorhabdus sp.]